MNDSSRKWWSRIGLAALGTFVAIQLVPYGRDHANPSVRGEPAWDAPATRVLTKQACFDCHSNETQWPAYASIAPASWLVQYDVEQGRAVLNFSEWRRPQKEAIEAAKKLREGEMPPTAYKWIHPHARLSAAELDRLARGLTQTIGAAGEQAAYGPER
jgi:hypothetical protein